jgi:hypothetical protein
MVMETIKQNKERKELWDEISQILSKFENLKYIFQNDVIYTKRDISEFNRIRVEQEDKLNDWTNRALDHMYQKMEKI